MSGEGEGEGEGAYGAFCVGGKSSALGAASRDVIWPFQLFH